MHIYDGLIYLSFFINIFLIIILFTPLSDILYKPLIVDDPPMKSDVIVILSGGAYNNGFPVFNTLSRTITGLELFRQGYAPKIICSGGKIGKMKISSAVPMKKALILFGVNEEDIIVQDDTLNTFNDLTDVLKKYKNIFDFNKSIFVTSSYHTYRVRKILKKKGLNPTIISSSKYELQPHMKRERFDFFTEIIREYLSIVYFKLRGWI